MRKVVPSSSSVVCGKAQDWDSGSGFRTQLWHWMVVWPCVSLLPSLNLCFPIYKREEELMRLAYSTSLLTWIVYGLISMSLHHWILSEARIHLQIWPPFSGLSKRSWYNEPWEENKSSLGLARLVDIPFLPQLWTLKLLPQEVKRMTKNVKMTCGRKKNSSTLPRNSHWPRWGTVERTGGCTVWRW